MQSGGESSRTATLQETRTKHLGAGHFAVAGRPVGLRPCLTVVAGCTGGPSTGPRSPGGLEKSRRSNWKHGRFSVAARHEAQQLRMFLREIRETLENRERDNG